MDDRITEVREAHRIVMKSIDNEWTLDDEAQHGSVKVLAAAARAYVDLLDSDALIIRRDKIDYEAIALALYEADDDVPGVLAKLDNGTFHRMAKAAVDALASSQGVEP